MLLKAIRKLVAAIVSLFSDRDDLPDDSGYVVEQGDTCLSIAPISGTEPVEEMYDYRTPYSSPSGGGYSSYGTTDLQRPETSICFLYDGPNGLSLVFVHDEFRDETSGGAVTFRLDDQSDASWLVLDDDYDADTNYDTFTETDKGWKADWTWGGSRSDGGVYGHLGADFSVTIHPAFNEAADLYGEYYDGELTDWQVLSGDRNDPERVSLGMDEPVTFRAGSCEQTQTQKQKPSRKQATTAD